MIKRLALTVVLLVNLIAAAFIATPTPAEAAAPAGWVSMSQRTANGALVTGPATPPLGTGSYRMTTGPGNSGPNLPQGGAGQGGKTWLTTQQFDGTLLTAITALGYSTYVTASPASTTITPSLQFQVDTDGDGDRDAALVFEPVYATGQPAVAQNTWQTWDAYAGKWWFTSNQNPNKIPAATNDYCASSCFNLFTDIRTDFPNAKIMTWFPLADGYGTQFQAGQNSPGGPWNDFDGNVDAFTITRTGASPAMVTADFEGVTQCTTTCFVNTATGDDLNKGGTSAADAKKTIQKAVNTVSSGGTINVAAGTYAENLVITKPLTLRGPKFGVNPNTVSRPAAGEAILMSSSLGPPDPNTTVVVSIAANAVTIDGVTIDGDNPAVTSSTAFAQLGANVDAVAGVSNANAVVTQATTVTNSIIKNLRDGIYLSMGNGRSNPGTPSLNNVITNNQFDNMSSRSPENGHAIALEDNVYGTITGNVATRVYMGVFVNNYYNPQGASAALISGNAFQSYGYGVFYNNQYGSASPWTITNNTLTTVVYGAATDAPGAIPNEVRNTGLLFWSLRQAQAATVTNNDVSGANYGSRIWNVSSAALPLISGGTLTGNNYGVRHYTCDVNFGQSGAGAATVILSGVTITGSLIAGIHVLDNPSARPADCTSTLPITVLAENVRETGPSPAGTTAGVKVEGVKASFGAIGSTFQGNQTGIMLVNGSTIAGTGLHFNAIVNNPAAGLNANGAGAGAINSENNWWGCNLGPGQPGCDSVHGGLGVDNNPWLTLRIGRTPNTPSASPGTPFAIVADLIINSDATDTSIGGTVQNGTSIAFGVAPAGSGTIAPASGPTVAGKVNATFTTGASGCPVIAATSDDQTVTTQLCINAAPSASPSLTPSASPTPAQKYTVTVSQGGSGTVSPPGTTSYTAGSQASYTAVAAAGQVFLGWTLDGTYVGYASPLTFAVPSNRTLVAQFVARPTFNDLGDLSADERQAITFLAAAGIVNPGGVNGSGNFEPGRAVKRAELAAFVARVFGWDDEFHANGFPDKCDAQGGNCVDDALWNSVAALADHAVVGGYTDPATCASVGMTAPCYLPRDTVKRVQVVSVVARAFIKSPGLRPTGFWDRLATDPAQYTNVPNVGTQRSDLTTYLANVLALPEQAGTASFNDPEGDGLRRFVVWVLYEAFNAQYGVDRVP